MEVIYILIMNFSALMNFFLYREIRKISQENRDISKNVKALADAYLFMDETIKKLSETAEKAPPKPMKPNNWDSVREAFKGPVRVEIHE